MIDAERGRVRPLEDRPVARSDATGLDAGEEGGADARLERGSVHAVGAHRGFRSRHARPVVGVGAVLPALQVRVLRRGERVVAALERRHVPTAACRVADPGEDRVDGRLRGDRMRPQVVGHGVLHPCHVACPLEDRVDVVGVRRGGGRGEQAAVDHLLGHPIPQRRDAVLVGRELRRGDDHPGAGDRWGVAAAVQRDRSGDRAVGDVVVPAGVAPEVPDAVPSGRRARAGATEHEEVSVIVGAHLTERHRGRRLTGEGDRATVEHGDRVRPGERSLARVDGEVAGRPRVASIRVRGLLVGDVHRPHDVGLVGGDLVDGAVVVMGEDPEPGRLPLHPALAVLEAAGRIGTFAGALGSDEEVGRTVAHAGEPDRWMDLVGRGHRRTPCRSNAASAESRSRKDGDRTEGRRDRAANYASTVLTRRSRVCSRERTRCGRPTPPSPPGGRAPKWSSKSPSPDEYHGRWPTRAGASTPPASRAVPATPSPTWCHGCADGRAGPATVRRCRRGPRTRAATHSSYETICGRLMAAPPAVCADTREYHERC